MAVEDLQSLITYTRSVFQTNGINPIILNGVQTFEQYHNMIDEIWGWDSDLTYFLFDGYYRAPQRTAEIISWRTNSTKT